jgi:hypothetical protein
MNVRLLLIAALGGLCSLAAAAAPAGTARALWDGKTWAGWKEIGQGRWSIEDRAIVGRQVASQSEYGHLLSEDVFSDFVVRLKFKAVRGNSGLYFRVEPVGFSGVTGFQAEIDAVKDVGGLYETNGRAWVVQPSAADVARWFKPGEWNEMTVRAQGGHVTVHINGHLSAEIRDDPGRTSGHFALQVHGGEDVEVWFKDLTIETL